VAPKDVASLFDRIDTFSTLLKCIAGVIEDCGGDFEDGKKLGVFVMDAVNAYLFLVLCM
jgi:hypothetical protein